MKLLELQQLFARDTLKLFQFIEDHNYTFTYGEAYRTPEQAELDAKTGIGIANSLHIKRLAIDINIFNEKGEYLNKTEDYELFGKFWESICPTNRWGGHFEKIVDGNHFERYEKASKE